MAAKFRKIDPRIWRDERFVALSSEEKLVALYCLTAQTNRCGIFVFSPAMAAEELGMAPETFRERFGRVVSGLRWRWDEPRRVLYFPTWWKYNPPESTNVLTGNLKDLDDLPETPLLTEFYSNEKHLPPAQVETFRKRWGERYPKPSPIQEQEQEQEQEQDSSSVPAAAGPGKEGASQTQKATAKRKPDPLFDAIVEVTGSAPAACGANIGKVRKALASESPPYTADEVRSFGSRFHELCPWAARDNRTRPELNELQKHIGKLRAAKKLRGDGPKPPVEFGRQPPME